MSLLYLFQLVHYVSALNFFVFDDNDNKFLFYYILVFLIAFSSNFFVSLFHYPYSYPWSPKNKRDRPGGETEEEA